MPILNYNILINCKKGNKMENTEYIGKRVNLDTKNLKRIKIITALLEDEVNDLNERKKIDYVINKAIESYYNSDEIKSLLEL